jgi:hypothetical protein
MAGERFVWRNVSEGRSSHLALLSGRHSSQRKENLREAQDGFAAVLLIKYRQLCRAESRSRGCHGAICVTHTRAGTISEGRRKGETWLRAGFTSNNAPACPEGANGCVGRAATASGTFDVVGTSSASSSS